MLKEAIVEDRKRIIDYVMGRKDTNIYFIADIEQYGLANDMIRIFYSEKEGKFSLVVLKYYGNYVFYSDKQDYLLSDLEEFILEYNCAVLSCNGDDYEYAKELFSKYEAIICDMAKLTEIKKANTSNISVVAKSEDARAIVESTSSISEFKVPGVDVTSEEYILDRTSKLIKAMNDGFHTHVIIKDKDKVVANANTSAVSSTSGVVGGVFTLPEYRNRGYAHDCVSNLCRSLLKANRTPILFYVNPVAAKIYKEIGFEDFDKWVVIKRNDSNN